MQLQTVHRERRKSIAEIERRCSTTVLQLKDEVSELRSNEQHQAELASLLKKMQNELETATLSHNKTLHTLNERETAQQSRHMRAREEHEKATALLQQQIVSLELLATDQSETAQLNAKALAEQQRASAEVLERTE